MRRSIHRLSPPRSCVWVPRPHSRRGSSPEPSAGAFPPPIGSPLPGVTVTVSSDALQGTRDGITDINGIYSLPGLPPGRYVVKFDLDSMSSVERRADVPLGAAVVDQQLALAPVKEVVEVRGATPSAVTSRGGVEPARVGDRGSCRSAARRSSSRSWPPG